MPETREIIKDEESSYVMNSLESAQNNPCSPVKSRKETVTLIPVVIRRSATMR